MAEPFDTAGISFWFDALDAAITPRPALDCDTEVDVAIVGAGYSGLWTAYYLKRLRPDLRIAVVEAEVAGFGASGRNGGWVTAHLSGLESLLEHPKRRPAGIALQRAMFDTVDEIGRVCAHEAIDCDYAKGGSVHFATNAAQRLRLRHDAESLAAAGLGKDDARWLEPDEVASHVRPARCEGGLYERHCAVVQPARLARGLAERVEAAGVALYERSRVTRIESGRVVTPGGTLRAETVVRATEAYTAALPGHERALLPLHSWMIATEPLSDAAWETIGLRNRETFGDARRMVTYGQRTADGRLAFGARGTYEYGSRIRGDFRADHPHFRGMEALLRRFFPVLAGVAITHRWGGALAVPRTWRPSVGLDRDAGLAWIGGYVGQGVAASNLAGRTLAELIAGEESERTRLAWVAAPARRWEREPLRWLVVSSVARAGEAADAAEDAGRRSRLAAALFRAVTAR